MVEREKAVVYITKYALTSGIKTAVAEMCGDGMVSVKEGNWTSHFHGKEWHRTPEAAIARAEETRSKKLAALKKQIAKLEKMTFHVVE